jgi:transcriptional regulator GlxA family with amidase domain
MYGASSENSVELRELCLRVLDRHKNVVLSPGLEAAEAVWERLSSSLERIETSVGDREVSLANYRCSGRPLASRRAPSALQTWRLRRVQEYIRAHISDTIRLTDLASASGLTRMYFAAQFRARMGVRPHEYVIRQRITHAQVLLIVTQTKIANVGSCVGFSNQAHFTTVFRRYVGTTPHRWRLSLIPEDRATPARASR